jgi:NAD(P)-dependent dehydrogenase (short-subunit alcohol dehydrogenase family)
VPRRCGGGYAAPQPRDGGQLLRQFALDLTTADWDKVVTVNLSGAFHMAQAALGHMLERGTGRIISESSIAGEIGNVGQANYAASKSGLLGLTKALARETAFLLARSGRLTSDTIGLTVNAVAPGLIATEMLDSVPAAALARLTTQIPCGRLGRPEEVARIVHVLAADASSYITGQVWSVNGGMDI